MENTASLGANTAIQADEMYERLRAGFRGALTMLVENNRPLVMSPEARWSYDGFLDAIERLGGSRGYYECQQCRSFWDRYSRVYGVNQDGKLTHPFSMVIDSLTDTYGDLFPTNTKARRHLTGDLNPVSRLRETFWTSECGGFNHMHGADAEVSARWNAERENYADAKNLEKLVSILSGGHSKYYTADIIRKLHAAVAPKLRIPEAIGLLVPFANLMDTIAQIRPPSLTTFLAVYMTEKRNSWLRGLSSSTADIVLSNLRDLKSEFNEAFVNKIVGICQEAVSVDKYKKRTAPTSYSAVDAATNMLKDNGWERFVERRLMTVDEVDTLWTPKPVTAADAAPAEDTRSALERASEAFRPADKSKTNAADDVAAVLGDMRAKENSREALSLDAFLELLDGDTDIAELVMIMPGQRSQVFVIASDAIDKVDYSGIMVNRSAAAEALPYATYIFATQPMPNATSVRVACNAADRAAVELPPAFRNVSTSEVRITGISKHDRRANPDKGAVVAFFDEGRFVYDVFSHAGSLVLGTMITEEHYGHSRAITQLSEKIPMAMPEGSPATGFVLDAGAILQATKRDGSKVVYSISSMK